MFASALDQTLENFKISGKDIAACAGLREATVSQFRRGKQAIQSDNLEKLIDALPREAKQYLFLNVLIDELDDDGIAVILQAIATKFKSGVEKSSQEREPALR